MKAGLSFSLTTQQPARCTASPKPGRVSLVGAGPGSADLITLRGLQRLKAADVIYYARLADPALLDYARPDVARVFVG